MSLNNDYIIPLRSFSVIVVGRYYGFKGIYLSERVPNFYEKIFLTKCYITRPTVYFLMTVLFYVKIFIYTFSPSSLGKGKV